MSKIPSTCMNIDLRKALAEQHPIRKGRSPYPPTVSASTADPLPFHIYHPAFLEVLGPNPQLELLIEDEKYTFAWEAPVYIPSTDELFFASKAGGKYEKTQTDINHNNKIFKIKLGDVKAGSKREEVTTDITPNSPFVQMINGGTNFGPTQMLFTCEGRGDAYPGGVVMIDTKPPYKATPVVYNVYGRRFCAPNDLCVHPVSGAIFFTDPNYAERQNFGGPQEIPNFVWRFDLKTGHLKAVADGIGEPNGIVFSPDGKIAYVTDTSAADGKGGFHGTRGAHVYAFDVIDQKVEGRDDLSSQTFVNRRLFAWVDTGVPDGIKVDTKGNVYAGCGDGVHVWAPTGVLLGKIVTGSGNSIGNLAFCGDGRLIFQSGERLWLARIAAEGVPLHTYPSDAL